MKEISTTKPTNPTPTIRAFLRLGISALITLSGLSLSAQEENRRSPNNFLKKHRRGAELMPPNKKKMGPVKMGQRTIEFPAEFRTIDGTGNNTTHPEWGASEIPFLRRTTVAYADGEHEPSGSDRPNPRTLSNEICDQGEDSILNRHHASDFIWQWGQFLDHDITHTPVMDPEEPFNILIPAGDPYFDPGNTGTQEMTLERSFYEVEDGIRQQLNEITAYVDASNVYGSNIELADELRTMDGSGRLETSDGDLLPFNVNAFPNAPSAHAPNFFLAGDFRANEQVGLTAMHTVFVREHNYWAGVVAKSNPDFDGDQIYEVARAIVGAEMQVITYNEFLPRLLGKKAIPRYRGYRPDLNAGISNVFATASYRFGHTMLSPQLLRLDRRLNETDDGHLDLAGAFFNPDAIVNEGGIDPVLRGLAHQPAQEIDTKIIGDVRNFLFGAPGAGGFDLASLNIQRGRDHGLPGYNEVRRNFGLDPVSDFEDITKDRDLQDRLEETFGDVELIDVWVGGLAEPPARGAMVGETIQAVLAEQFRRLRDGDRFWYQNHLSRELQRLIESQTLSKIIKRNTEISREISENLWSVGSGGPVMTGGGGRGPGARPPIGGPSRRR